jgi:hypothetical protein
VTRPASPFRRLERWVVGLGMAVIAFILEKVVIRSVRRSGSGGEGAREPTTLTSRGGDVDLQ